MTNKVTTIVLLLGVILLLLGNIIITFWDRNEEAIDLLDERLQLQLENELKKNNIYFRKDDSNNIWFYSDNKYEVKQIASRIMARSTASSISFTYKNPKYMEMLKIKLKKNNVILPQFS